MAINEKSCIIVQLVVIEVLDFYFWKMGQNLHANMRAITETVTYMIIICYRYNLFLHWLDNPRPGLLTSLQANNFLKHLNNLSYK